MSARRTIAHFDLDAFFVSVECLLNPELKGLPLIVGGSRERGVVAACSYEARKFGIHSAMPIKTALTKCPHATIIPGTRGAYSHYSRLVTEIIAAGAPVVEKASIDEFYLDLTGMDRFHQTYEWTIALREEIRAKTGLPISFGLASNKMVAKIATDEAKPDGYLFIPHGREAEFLAPLSVNKIPGVGTRTYALLQQLNIQTIGDLAAHPVEELRHVLGNYGAELSEKARGKHDAAVEPYHEARSVSTENTFEEDSNDLDFLHREIVRMTEKAAQSLRKENKMSGCLTIKVRYSDFSTTTRQLAIPYTFYDDELIPVALDIFRKLYDAPSPVRLLGIRLSELTAGARQTNLFSDHSKKDALYKTIDDLNNRFGRATIAKATWKTPEKLDRE